MTAAMSARFSFHTQLSSIMETMVRTALTQVCKLVDEDSTELRSEVSRLLVANAALTKKLNSLECELTLLRSEATLPKSCRTVGVQAGGSRDRSGHVIGSPTIEGIYGKDWCMDLWKDRNPCSLERVGYSTQCSDKEAYHLQSVVPFSHQITVTEIKEEDYVAGSCPQETLRLNIGAEHEDCLTQETEEPSIEYSIEDSTCSLSFDQEEEQVVSAGGLGEPSMQLISIKDAEEVCSTYIIPISEDSDDDVESIEGSKKEPSITAAGEPTQNKQQTLAADSENNTAPDRDAHENFNIFSRNKDKFTCEICSRTFFHKGTLTRHMKTHKSNFCQICKQHFRKKGKLKTHMCVPQVPSQGISSSCELCGKTFANPSALTIHHVVHTGEKPHRCKLCGKGFTQKGNLKCHLRIHTGERPFHCIKCGKTFTQKVSLNHHLIAHRNREVKGETHRHGRLLKN